MKRQLWVFLLVGLVLVGFVVAGASQVSAQTVIDECGELDRGEYELTQDLTGNQETCIEITGDGVVLDGMGHSIMGDGQDGVEPGAVGILVTAERGSISDVTVTNVTVENWDAGEDEDAAGIRFENADGGEITDVDIGDNDVGVQNFPSLLESRLKETTRAVTTSA